MGQSSSSHRHLHRRDLEFEQPSPYASAVVRKTPHLETTTLLSSSNGGMRRARSIRHDVNGGGFQDTNHHHSSSSTASSSQKSTSTSTVSSSSAGTRYIPHMKSGKGLTMPRGGAPLHGGNTTDVNGGGGGGYTSPDAWGFHINITPTQEVYAASAGGPTAGLDPKRRQNQVFKNLQSANKTNMGWTSVPI